MTSIRKICITGVVLATAIGCGDSNANRDRRRIAPPPTVTGASSGGGEVAEKGGGGAAKAAVSGWGTIKGRLVWNGAPPAAPEITVTKDEAYCKANGPIHDETWTVDPKTNGIKNCIVFIKNPAGIHPDLPQSADKVTEADEKKFKEANGVSWAEMQKALEAKTKKAADFKADAFLDQIRCRYVPHAIALREGQRFLILNPEDVSHNVKAASNIPANEGNWNMPPNSALSPKWKQAPQPVKLECSIHGWMNGFAMVFDHPYFAVTKEDGSFEIKNAPAGTIALVIQSQKEIISAKGGKGSAKGDTLTLNPNGTLDLGEIKFSSSN